MMNNNVDIRTKKIAFIVNGKSQRGRKLFKHALELFKLNEVELKRADCVRKPKDIKKIIIESIAAGINMIIIGGGDGTISEAVDFGVKNHVLFAILPLGTSNSFARSLQMPLDLESAVATIKAGNVAQIDLGQIGRDYFANTANLGISMEVNRSVNNDFKRNFGRLAYLPLAIWKLITFEPFEITLITQKTQIKYKVIEVLIANGQFQGGIPLALNAKLESGKLIVKLFLCSGWTDKINLLGYWFLSLFRHNIRNRRIVQFAIDSVNIDTVKPIDVDIDGEFKTQTPINVSVAKGVLSIIVP